MRFPPLAICILILLPPIFCLVAVDAFGSRGLLSYLGSWVLVCLALLATGVIFALVALGHRRH